MNTKEFLSSIEKIKPIIDKADAILVGAGSGLSASGGLDYNDGKIFSKLYSNYRKKGIKNITDGISKYWIQTDDNRTYYWAFWSTHINNVLSFEVMKPYIDLYNLVNSKEYFVITTNADEQFKKAGFKDENVFMPQGDYGYFQCMKPCSDDIYDNNSMVLNMLNNMDKKELKINIDDVPKCPKCGEYMEPNLRKDNRFVEKPHMKNGEAYHDFIRRNYYKNLVLLELGVGFNTPVKIRHPFEDMAKNFENTVLIRVNKKEKEKSSEKIFYINDDAGKVLNKLVCY